MSTSGHPPIHLASVPDWESRSIAPDVSPSRASVTVNCLIPVKSRRSPALLCHNFDPKNWNQWFPPFTFHHTDIPGSFLSEGQLLGHVTAHSSLAAVLSDEPGLRHGIAEHVKKLLAAETITIASPAVRPAEYWLKFSESRKTWTLYCFIWYCAQQISPSECMKEDPERGIALIPFGATEYLGLPVVENVVEIWKDTELSKRLATMALPLE